MWKRSKLKHKVQKQNQTKNTQSTPTQNAIQIERNTNTRKKKQQKRRKKPSLLIAKHHHTVNNIQVEE
jgi:hypothetical protein